MSHTNNINHILKIKWNSIMNYQSTINKNHEQLSVVYQNYISKPQKFVIFVIYYLVPST